MRQVSNCITFKTGILMGALFFVMLPLAAQTDSQKKPLPTSDTLVPVKNSKATVVVDADESETDTSKTKRGHSSKTAVISSMILPGLGQAYNRKYFKIPVIYGTGMFIYYYYDRYNYEFKRYKKAYEEYKSGSEISDPELAEVDITQIEGIKTEYQRRRDYQIIFMGMLYAANIIDALVDSYMYEFDISDDLTMKIQPTLIVPPVPGDYASCGMRLSLRF